MFGWPKAWLGRIGQLLAGRPLRHHVALAAVLVFAASATIIVWASLRSPLSVNPMSRLATITSLTGYHDWSIDESIFADTPDKVRVQERFYSSKPPTYAALGAVLYGLWYQLTGFHASSFTPVFLAFMRLALQGLPFLFGLLLAGRFLGRMVTRDGVWFWGFVAIGLGTFWFGYAGDINNHTPAAALVLAALAGALALEGGHESRWTAFGVGFCVALATALDLGVVVFAVGLTVFVAFRTSLRRWAWTLLGAAGPALVHIHLTYALVGTWRPFYGQGQFYHYPGSYWAHPTYFDALHEPLGVYAFNSLLGHRGLFSMTPIFLLAVPGVVMLMATRGARARGLLMGATALLTILGYLLYGPRNYGGICQGMRWFIILAPLLWLAACLFVDRFGRFWPLRWLFAALVLVGVYNAMQVPLTTPWTLSPWHELLREHGLGSLPPYNSFFQ